MADIGPFQHISADTSVPPPTIRPPGQFRNPRLFPRFPMYPKHGGNTWYVVKPGDTLQDIIAKTGGNQADWLALWNANNHLIPFTTMQPEVGQRLTIPWA